MSRVHGQVSAGLVMGAGVGIRMQQVGLRKSGLRKGQADCMHAFHRVPVSADDLPGGQPACLLMWKGKVAYCDATDGPQGANIAIWANAAPG